MAVSLESILAAVQNGVEAINSLSKKISTVFPQASALSTGATAGAVTFSSSQAATFLTVTTSSGGSYKVPLYNP